MTPHINAKPGDFADLLLFPGDPLRAKYIADTFLEDAVEVTNVRNMLGFTGTWQGHRVSVMGHGMGIPSISIYAEELIRDYGVKTLIRIGSCGGVAEDLKLRDVVVATGAGTASLTNRTRLAGYDYPAVPDFGLAMACHQQAQRLGIPARFGTVFTNDLFYGCDPALLPALQRMKVLAVEMEAAALYAIAAEQGARALTILTVSDHLLMTEETSAEERQNSFSDMVELALATGVQPA
ncbi:purine-nucleoside phosphorylase [Ferrimonas sp. YFM]|uniref:purine-nucleoside phosphorylase n=1 Tax=Ferrimonas sp. YFM TaxID=3028878 RepID=UPI0025742331|nr:purine-nucleoside phosphorylase [Ferrimonas sp. YFM]BDY06526.1 purine nucleoside phosphorylase DeoD-type [Ferrimonas sp. YFM]